jgi:hypothetical protein
MRAEIAGGADAVAVMSKFLGDAGIGMDTLKAKTEGASGAIKDATIQGEKFKLALAGEAGTPAAGFLEAYTNSLKELGALLSGDTSALEARNRARIAAEEAYAAAIRAGKTDVEAFAIAQDILRRVEAAGSVEALRQADIQAHLASEHLAGAAASDAAAVAQAHLASEHRAGGEATDLASRALANQTQESIQAQIKAQELLAFQEGLARIGSAVAAGHLSAADGAAILASQYGRTSGEAERLIGLQAQLARLQNTAIVGRSTNVIGSQGVGAFLQKQEELAAEKVKDVFANLLGGARTYENSRTSIARSGGAARLSDQAKLNNALLAGQEKYQDQAEAAEQQHLQKIADIEAEFQRRSLEQQRVNEAGKRNSRADFYDSLTSATKDVGGQVAQELSAAYEQAYAEAQAIAAAGNAKLAADYLALKQKQIQAELEFQKQIAEARKNKDAGEIARLEAIHKLRLDTAAEEEKQLRAGGIRTSISAMRPCQKKGGASKSSKTRMRRRQRAPNSAR